MTTLALIDDLKRDEGLRLCAYQDAGGVWTIGYGHTGADVRPGEAWSETRAALVLACDVADTVRQLDRALPWWRALDQVRQDAVANWAFNVGVGGVLGFRHALAVLEAGDWHAASAAMHLSDWARDPPAGVGERAARIIDMIRTGERP
jgi:lysozyme